MSILAPIVLFVYNRPEHTKQTLEALSANDLARESSLYVFSDGPKAGASEADLRKIAQVREIVLSRSWCKSTALKKRDVNIGLAENIVQGVTEVLQSHDNIIVLEDDIITSSYFLTFMNASLSLYNDDEQVMHVSGYFPNVRTKLPDTFFIPQSHCWGWATWRRAWVNFSRDTRPILQFLHDNNSVEEFNAQSNYHLQLLENHQGKRRTWAVKWYGAIFMKGGLCLHPNKSLIENVGMDGTGENSGTTNVYNDKSDFSNVPVNRIPLTISNDAITELHNFYRNVTKKPKKRVSIKYRIKKKVINGLIKASNLLSGAKISEKPSAEDAENNRLRKFPRYVTTKTFFQGRSFTIVDAASYLFIRNELFNQGIYEFISNTPTPYIIDCGANIGLSVIYFKQLYSGARVLAFEPDTRVFEALKNNIEAFELDNVVLLNKGLWNEEKTIRFFSEGADAGRIAKAEDSGNMTIINVVKLRDYLIQPVDFLKIDIEGAELTVLKDCADLLHHVKNLFVEYHSFNSEEQKLDELLALLRAAGFRYLIQQHGVVSPRPFKEIVQDGGMDILLNISAFRNSV